MSEERFDKIISLGAFFCCCILISVPFFWIQSCQNTEVVKACLQFSTPENKAACMGLYK
jgi:hypothetical protein